MDALEQELWNGFRRDPNPTTRNALIEWYLPWVRKVAALVHRSIPESAGLEIDDLVSDSLPGVIRCLERFDLDRGLKFTTFALPRVRGAISDALRDRDWVPRVERSRHRDGEGIPRVLPIDSRLSEWDDRGWDLLAGAHCYDDHDPERDEFWRDICRGLSRQERLALMLYWREGLRMKEVGEQLGLSESRISQMLSAVYDRLRERTELVPFVARIPEADQEEQETMDVPETKLTSLLDKLSAVKVEDIDAEITLLQARIESLTRLRHLVDPASAPPAKKNGGRRTAAEMEQLAQDIRDALASGPLSAGKIAKKVEAVVSTVQRLLESGKFKKLKDGTWSVA